MKSALVLLIAAFGLSLSKAIIAATIIIPANQSVFNCSSVMPGSQLVLPAGTRGALRINDCRGEIDKPIRLVSDQTTDAATIIARNENTEGGYVLMCKNCKNFVIDGTKSQSEGFGIKVTIAGGASPSWFVRLTGLIANVTIRGIEVDGRWPEFATNGIGISLNDHSISKESMPSAWFENIVIDHNYVHSVEGEGMYIGPNWFKGGLPLRNITITNNRVETTGWDGINLKSAIQGRNIISNNFLKDVGIKPNSESEQAGIAVYESTAEVSSNTLINVGAQGIFHFLHWLPEEFGVLPVKVINNLVVNVGLLQSKKGFGIKSSNQMGYAIPSAVVRFNTVIGATAGGIDFGYRVRDGIIENNLLSEVGLNATAFPSGTVARNNLIVERSKATFSDPTNGDYSLAATSTAIDRAIGEFPAFDLRGSQRPQGASADVGAFEFLYSNNSKPQPPTVILVQ